MGDGSNVTGDDNSPLPDTEVHYLRSEHVGAEFKVLIGHCGSPGDAAPAGVFLGDPWANFGTAVEIARLLREGDHLPATLIVGIGYRVARMEENFDLRSRDFTPSVDMASGYKDRALMGGADRFSAFIRDELKPWVRDRYGIDPGDSVFFGDSLGGLYATYLLLSDPGAFRGYGIGSPSLWWDDELLFKLEAEYAQAHDDLPARVFVSVGEYETLEGRRRFLEWLPPDKRAKAEAEDKDDPPVDMVAGAERMVAQLRSRGYPSLEIEYQLLPREYHITSPSLNLSRSLRYLFDAPR